MKLIVANWKMHLNPHESSLLVKRLDDNITAKKGVTVVLCPAFIDLYPLAREVDVKKFKLGAQNVFYLDEGAYTGEISPTMLKGLASYVIVGHSERRALGEDDKLIAKKVAACLRSGLKPILCIGDTLLEREHGHSVKVVIDQLTAGLKQVTAKELSELAIAYEPVWAIGTGNYAKPGEVEPVAEAIRHTVEELYGEGSGSAFSLLYGGSSGPENARSYLEMDGIDGLLVGGESLNYQHFAEIVKIAETVAGG